MGFTPVASHFVTFHFALSEHANLLTWNGPYCNLPKIHPWAIKKWLLKREVGVFFRYSLENTPTSHAVSVA